jgi:DNA segregation ATPase FtsK/SpoIIIE, S-DNA-T family
MIFEAVSSIVMGGIALKAHLSKSGVGNDSNKIQRLFTLSGLNVKEGKNTYTTQLLKKKNYEWGTEYRYRIPQGRSFEDYVAKQKVFEAGINTRQVKLNLKDIKDIKFDKNIITSIQSIYEKKLTQQKEIELSFDGLLKIRVYNEPLPQKIIWNSKLLKKGTWSVCIGSNRTETIYHDFDNRKHLIIAGSTGFGKSVIMKSIITSLILSKPIEVTFSLIDLKGGSSFARFKTTKQVVNFGIDTNEALIILKDVQEKMNIDYKKIVDDGFEDVSEAGIKRRHFLIIDEAADIVEDKKCMEILTDIVRKGRGAGYYVIYATQYPSSEAIPMQIKRNIPARLYFVLDSATASTTVFDGAGAESLPEIPGRGIYKEVKQKIIQSPIIDNKTIKELQPHIFDKEVMNSDTEATKRETRKNTAIIKKTRLS